MKKRITLSIAIFLVLFIQMGMSKTGYVYDYTPLFKMEWGLDKAIIGYFMFLISAFYASIPWLPKIIAKHRQPWAF